MGRAGSLSGAFLGPFADVVRTDVDLAVRVDGRRAGFTVNGYFREAVSCRMAPGVGCIEVLLGGRTYHLLKAILRDRVLGEFKETPDIGVVRILKPVRLRVNSAAGVADSQIRFSNLILRHDPSGALLLTGDLLAIVAGAESIPLRLKGTLAPPGRDVTVGREGGEYCRTPSGRGTEAGGPT